MGTMDKLMAERKKLMDNQILAQLQVQAIENDVKLYLIDHQLTQELSVNWDKLNRQNGLPPDRFTKQEALRLYNT